MLRSSALRAARFVVAARQTAVVLPRPVQSSFLPRFYSAHGGLTKDEVEGRILEVVKAFDKVTDPAKITPAASFANDLGLDSLDTVEVVMAIEEEFSIEIPDKEADQITSIGQAIDYILAQEDAV
ncbi:acyl carrier protein-like protein [Lipomyces oligophaga]|uniref:acyl carrier protein-like protein n=1 Tax=Lipomyces oligophaga TaxID=45792 RepID=UPI0034CFB947